MPENKFTLTANEKRITEYVSSQGKQASRSKIQRLALKWHKRQELISNDELRRLFDHSDPTANIAIRNVMKENNGPGTIAAKQCSEAV